MRWSVEPPHDPVLFAGPDRRLRRSADLAADLTVERILCHRPGVRLDVMAVDASDERLTVSWHADRHAVAEAGRIRVWHAAGVGPWVPAWASVADAGRIGLTAWVDGTPLDRLDDGAFVLGAWSAGEVLDVMHRSGAILDRTTVVPAGADRLPVVPSLGGASPSAVAVREGVARWFDIGASIMAPAAVDVAGFVARLRGRRATRDADVVQASIDAFLDGYGIDAACLDEWIQLLGLHHARSTPGARS